MTNPAITVRCIIDTDDWQPGASTDRQWAMSILQCEDRLTAWFSGLSARTQLSIYYAQRHQDVAAVESQYWPSVDGDTLRMACPFLRMVEKAENRIWYAVTKTWLSQPESGYNFHLTTHLHLTRP